MVTTVLDAPAGAEELEGLTKGELLSMLRFGADRIFKNEKGAAPSDAELDAIIDRSSVLGKTGVFDALVQYFEWGPTRSWLVVSA